MFVMPSTYLIINVECALKLNSKNVEIYRFHDTFSKHFFFFVTFNFIVYSH